MSEKNIKPEAAKDGADELESLLNIDDAEIEETSSAISSLVKLGEENKRLTKSRRVISIIMSKEDVQYLNQLRKKFTEDSNFEKSFTHSGAIAEIVMNTKMIGNETLVPNQVSGGMQMHPITKVTQDLMEEEGDMRIKLSYSPSEEAQNKLDDVMYLFEKEGLNPSETQIIKTMMYQNKI